MTATLHEPAGVRRSFIARCLRWIGLGLAWLIVFALVAWAIAALSIDMPVAALRLPVAIIFGAAILAAIIFVRGVGRKLLACLIGFVAVLAWWLTIAPSNDRAWQGDVTQTPWAEIDGDRVTIHNVRNFDYRAEFDYTPRWEDRTYDLSQIRGADIFLTYWGSPWIAHPIVSFQFGEGDHIAFSIETRKEVGEEYSAFKGFFRQYELIYIIADERDVIRLRTNYRTGEEVYLYHTVATPEAARSIFLDYLRSATEMHEQPVWYNALTSNCTTNIRIHTKVAAGDGFAPWDWRLLLNGKSDEFGYEYGRFASDGLSFEALKQQAHINDAARVADQAADFSARVRQGRVGFASAAVQ
ncbi:MAG TPA: DUF4105 domain-containing protein [Dongiaceae bacterium]|nr:DUF4105 domain-containing protein [Dongiaceae bacterium]